MALAYTVHFTRGVFDPANALLWKVMQASPEAAPQRALCFVDSGLAEANPALVPAIAHYFAAHARRICLLAPPAVLTGGEAGKNSFDVPQRVLGLARQVHLSRHAHVLAVGGGAFLDAVGFAAALVHRGARLLRVPSTVLAQNDAGIGVKNGINLGGVKNFVGTFAAPAAVLNDCDLLATLPDRDWTAGTAEAFKVAMIKDAAFLEWLLVHADSIRRRRGAGMEELVYRCACLHLEHIQTAGDPFEQGTARPLDFGHWAAHKLESLSNHELHHGEAVAIGVALDLLYAARLGFVTAEDARRALDGMRRMGLSLYHPALAWREPSGRFLVLNGVEEFREHLGGTLSLTLPKPLGRKTEVAAIDEELVAACIAELRELAAGPA